MIFLELQIDGHTKFSELSSRQFLRRASLDAKARFIPVPATLRDAVTLTRESVYYFQHFDDFASAESWIGAYHGFRCHQVRTEFDRFKHRRARSLASAVLSRCVRPGNAARAHQNCSLVFEGDS